MMRTLLSAGTILACLTLSATAQTPTAAPVDAATRIHGLVQEAKGKYVPFNDTHITAAYDNLRAWAKYLEPSLGNPANAAAWKSFLLWDDLQQELHKPTPTVAALLDTSIESDADKFNPDKFIEPGSTIRRLSDVWDRFRRNEKGLELPAFTGTRDSLRHLINVLSAIEELRRAMVEHQGIRKAIQPAELYEQKLNELDEAIIAFEAAKNLDNAMRVRKPLYWLARQHQAANLVASVGSRFNQVNAHGQFSAHFLAEAVDQPIHQTQPVNDNILGTSVHGTATMNGTTWMRPAASTTNGRMELNLNGLIHSKTTGYNGPVTIYSTGRTSVQAHKTLYMTSKGLIALPSHACAKTNTNIDCIAAKRRIVEKIAWKRASRSLSEAEAIASEHAAEKVEDGLDERTAEFVNKANGNYQEKILNPLIRSGTFPQLLTYNSSGNNLYAYMTRAAGGQLSAFDGRPPADLRYDVTAQLSESMIMNMGESILGGYTLTDVAQLTAENKLREPGKRLKEWQLLDEIDHDERWALTFADEMPVRVEFRNNQVRIFLRIKRVESGESSTEDRRRAEDPDRQKQRLPGPYFRKPTSVYETFEMETVYDIVRDGYRVTHLQRRDDIEGAKDGVKTLLLDRVTNVELEQQPVRLNTWKTMLRRKFAESDEDREEIAEAQRNNEPPPRTKVFKQRIEIEDIQLGGRFENQALILADFQAQNGWAVLAWRLGPKSKTVVQPSAPALPKPDTASSAKSDAGIAVRIEAASAAPSDISAAN